MSTAVFGSTSGSVWDDATPAVIASTRSPMALSKRTHNVYPQVTGDWAGTCKVAGSKRLRAVSMHLATQKGPAAIGTFKMGPITIGRTVVSTAIVGRGYARDFRVIFDGKDFYGSITATVSANGQEILGRWACNGPGGWKTGTVVMRRV